MSNAIANQLYLAYLGRPADTAWRSSTTAVIAGANAPSVALQNAFYSAAVLDGTFSLTDSSSQLVNKIFLNVFGFSASTFEQNAWATLINNGTITAQTAAWTIFSSYLGATNVPSAYQQPAQSKLLVIDAYTNELANQPTSNLALSSLGSTAAQSARTFISTISSQATAAPAITGISATVSGVSSSTTGSTFTLTTASDSFTGTSSNDVFNGTDATYNAGDVLAGGAGTDTLSLIMANDVTLVGSQLSGIEVIQANATAAKTLTFSNVTGATTLVNNNSSAVLTVAAAPLVNVTLNAVTAATSVTYADSAVSGTADAVTLTLSGTGSATTQQAVTLKATTAATNEIESLAIAASGTNGITLTTDGTQTSLKTITVTGTGSLALALANDKIITSATTINASAATGSILVGGDAAGLNRAGTQALGAANHTVTLGSGNDAVYFGANLDTNDTVDGGAGTDILGVTAAVTNAALTNVKNFEVLRLDASGGNITQDAGISALSSYGYQVSGANTVTLNNLANSATATVIGDTTTLTMVLKDGSGQSDALTFGINNKDSSTGSTLTTLTAVSGLETLNIVATGTNANTITTDNVAAKHVVTGSGALTIGSLANATNFDASAATGKITITTSNTATTVLTGSAGDVITLGTGNDTVNAGAGADTINFGSTGITSFGADSVIGGAGNDSFRFTATGGASANLTNYSTFSTITDFTVGTTTSATDFLAFSGTDTNFGATGAGGAATGLSKGATAAGLTAADAMVVQSVAQNASAATLTTNVSFIKLSTGVAFTTDVGTTAAAAIGTASVTNLAANGVYLLSYYDTTNSKMVLITANTGTSANNDTTLSSADLTTTAAAIHIVGIVNMTAADYATFGATNLGAAL